MKTGALLFLSLALLPAAAGLVRAQQDSPAPAGAQAAPLSATDWADCAALEKRLAAAIRKQLKGIDKSSILTFLAEPSNRLLLAQWQLAHAEQEAARQEHDVQDNRRRHDIERLRREAGTLRQQLPATHGSARGLIEKRLNARESALKAQEAELASPRSMEDALKLPGAAELLQKLTVDVQWMEQMAYSGECLNPGRAIAILATLAHEHPGLAEEPMPRAIATATALEWAKYGWNFAPALERARFYIENDRARRLNSGFRQLPFWQLRIVCGSKGDNANGSVASLRWALENVHLPADQYPGSCWQANYLTFNLFGDTIHGPHYYDVYSDVYGDNAVQRTKDVGGVCGSLSHFGAFSALANGVPALTAGEPGHCAYIVLVNGKWTPAYSVSWQRGLHWQVWRGVHVYSSLHMATELYGDEQRETTALSNACRTLGNMYAAEGQRGTALNCLRAAVKTQPRNYPAWCDYAAFAKEHYPNSAKVWAQLNADICRQFATLYPEMAAELLRNKVYPHLNALPDKQLAPTFSAFWKAVDGMGPDRWRIEDFCNAQLSTLKGRLNKPTEALAATAANKLYSLILRCTANKPAYATTILAWGNGIASAMDAKTQKLFLRSTLAALSKDAKGNKAQADDAARDRMLGQALLGAAAMRDRNSFQAIGSLLSANYREPKGKLPEWEPFPGKLVSQGGLLCTSSTCGHDDPAAHWGVLEPVGGRFHTKSEENAWAVVQLPKPAILSGVVTIAPHGNLWRLAGMKVQYSESGRDDDWHDAGALPDPTGQRVNRLDLQGRKLRARYIRILRPGGPQFFHLNAIFVYGKPTA